jgi:hypothetical protein
MKGSWCSPEYPSWPIGGRIESHQHKERSHATGQENKQKSNSANAGRIL